MKYVVHLLFIFIAINYLPISAETTKPATPPQKQNWIQDQDDQTDTYAIPLDTSEEEEKEEEKQLQKKTKKGS